MAYKLKHPNDWAKEFKLYSCINNPKFAKQVTQIQNNAHNQAIKLVLEVFEDKPPCSLQFLLKKEI